MIRYEELRRALSLSNELRELPHGSDIQRLHLLDGLCGLVGGQVGLWCDTAGVGTGPVVLRTALDRGWCGEAERATFLKFFRDEQLRAPDPSMLSLAKMRGAAVATLTHEQLVDDRTWYRSAHVQDLRRVARVDSFIDSAVHTSRSELLALCLGS